MELQGIQKKSEEFGKFAPVFLEGDKNMRVGIRGYCNRDCIYSDNGRCDMYDDFAMPEDVDNCDNYTEDF